MQKYSKTILCLANSRKTSGRCIAGRELVNNKLGDWIRPVSARDSGELSELDRRYKNGRHPQVLDIIRIPMLAPNPHQFQAENHLIDDEYYWTLERQVDWAGVQNALDGPAPLWINGDSSYSGINDRVSAKNLEQPQGTLRLIKVSDLRIEVVVEGAEFNNGKRKVRGRFTYGGAQHYLSITDPQIEAKYFARANGIFQIGEAILCISLGEIYNDYAYKLIASVITA
ncbi:hypothetical protein WNY59_06385 [Ahrensia kielensis]|uniref:Dual OB-containing domain-containing protein n=1 Tax=Ahrensia kielensis TaxID=76980 RepID=A0ABU9T635_9HYPH